jgi:TetR/AcrR family transcriptional regulator, tetracycline repressor protein
VVDTARAGLTRGLVVRAALDLLDEVGLDKLSTRRLADRLGVRSPALYWHVKDKPQLLDLMAQELLRPDTSARPAPADDLREAWAATARERRRRLLSRRDGARLVSGTRPGPDVARAAEEGIAELVGAGLTPATALHTLIAISHFVTGFVIEEQAAAAREVPAHGGGEDFPLLRAAIESGGAPEGDRAFEHGLGALIDGLARNLLGVARETMIRQPGEGAGEMTEPTVLVIGFDPNRLPVPDKDTIAAALERGQDRFADLGLSGETCLIGMDDQIEAEVTAALRARPWNCVVIGGGIRKPPQALELFELMVNLVRRHAPDAAIAFNTSPEDSADAAVRALAV